MVGLENRSMWKVIWRIKAPPKVLNMVWRAFSQCLPTKVNLYAKYVPVTTMCPICNGEEETILHVLVDYPFADGCWRKRDRMYQGVEVDNFADWLNLMFNRTKKEDHAEIVTLCWAIWNARNKMVWNDKKPLVEGVVMSMKQYLAEWSNAQKNTTQALYQFVEHGDGAHSWVRPKNDAVKITVDAATFAENSSFGVEMLARDEKGEVLLGRSELYQGNAQPVILQKQ